MGLWLALQMPGKTKGVETVHGIRGRTGAAIAESLMRVFATGHRTQGGHIEDVDLAARH